jgi:hypothetical protein
MQMHMLVERRAKPVLKRDRTQPRAGLSRCAALARKRHQKAMATACALCPRKPKAEQPAGQIPTKLFFNMPPDWPAALVVLGKPALQVSGDDLIERRSLRPPTGITLLWSLSPRGG